MQINLYAINVVNGISWKTILKPSDLANLLVPIQPIYMSSLCLPCLHLCQINSWFKDQMTVAWVNSATGHYLH